MPNAPVDPIAIFRTADAYYQGGLVLGAKIPKSGFYVLPYAVLGALTLELYLKCLIALETGKNPPRGHNLEKLFNNLSKDGRKKIRLCYDNPQHPKEIEWREKLKNPPANVPEDIKQTLIFNFDDDLRRSSRAFERFRYAYETSVPGDELIAWQANYIIYCTRLHIIQNHRPEWGAKNQPKPRGAPPTSPH